MVTQCEVWNLEPCKNDLQASNQFPDWGTV